MSLENSWCFNFFFNLSIEPRGLGLQSIKPAQVGQSFQIFNDENQDPSLPGQQGDWSDVPTKAAVNKENERKAGVWSKAKVRSQRQLDFFFFIL